MFIFIRLLHKCDVRRNNMGLFKIIVIRMLAMVRYGRRAEIVTHSTSNRIIVVEQGDKIFALSLVKLITLGGADV